MASDHPLALGYRVADSLGLKAAPLALGDRVADSLGLKAAPLALGDRVADSLGRKAAPLALGDRVADSLGRKAAPLALGDRVADSLGLKAAPLALGDRVADSLGLKAAPVHVRLCIDLSWPYDRALAQMHAARDEVIAGGPMTVFIGSHSDEVVTLGRHAPEEQLVNRSALTARGVLVRRIERGGGATAHGPGQLVVYPVLDLARVGLTIPAITAALLGACADLAAELGICSDVVVDKGTAGVFVAGAKLASIGMRVERGVVTHGVALNCDNDVALFDLIAPCGVRAQPIASLQSLSRARSNPDLRDLADRLAQHVASRCMLAWS